MKHILYFAYGHNTNIPELQRRIPHAKLIGRATAPNFKLELKHYTNIIPEDGAKTYGVLWGIDEPSLKILDWYEGEGKDYNHAIIEVFYKNILYKALTYFMLPSKSDINKLPSHKYLKHVADGYKQNDIPLAQLKTALQHNHIN